MFILGTLVGVIIGMFLMSCISVNTINEKDSLVRASRKSLRRAENKVRDFNEENKVLYKENKELEVNIVDLENNIELLVNNSRSKKLKELVTDGKSEN